MTTFQDVFGSRPEVYARAPGRVNLLGEHTDYNEGFVLPIAIPQSTRVAMRRSPGAKSRVHAVAYGRTVEFAPGTDAPMGQDNPFARYVSGTLIEIAHEGFQVPALDILVVSDVPIGVGLSSSAALEVAVLRALRELLELDLDDVRIAQVAQRAEIEHAGVRCGIMDQMASSLADTRSALFLDTRTLRRQLVPLPEGSSVLVMDSGVARSLATSGYNQRRAECEAAAAALGVPALRDVEYVSAVEQLGDETLRRRARHVVSENQRVLSAAAGCDARGFGTLMNASHASLRDDYEVSVPEVDRLVELLQQHPAVFGARMTGAGWGGACVALCQAGMQEDVARAVLPAYAAGGGHGRALVPELEDEGEG
ncbi:galactokinase [uncultured Azohydromonas sp.]|jgi:galactokinase|uniref:galactokinase n=1 Tax=uncultured Azohydromonas sp. TaxID=487342 RepID=UPI0026269D66|nr:galactokinase [uncultured Azohydromonas sp.]